jgi:pimeloyl-ACP methyl ester carboxylesterase
MSASTALTNTIDMDLAYDDRGSGDAVVLGHSFLCSGEMWREQVEPLASEYRIINVDYRGHGASSHATSPFTLSDMVRDVVGVLDRLGIERAVWAGLSVGGMVSLRAALEVPDRVTAMILIDTDGGQELAWTRLKYAAMGAIARVGGMRLLRGAIVERMFGATTRRTNPELVTEWAERFVGIHVPSALRMLAAMASRNDLLPRLSSVHVPALVVVGKEDASLPPQRSMRLAEALPNATYVEVAGAGHLSALERPADVTAAMLDFLRTRGASAEPSRPGDAEENA